MPMAFYLSSFSKFGEEAKRFVEKVACSRDRESNMCEMTAQLYAVLSEMMILNDSGVT